MSASRRAEWLLARRLQWCGMSPQEVVDGDLSPRVVRLITEMREAGLFPDLWDETDVLFAFLGAVAEARLMHRGVYIRDVKRSERLATFAPGSADAYPRGKTVLRNRSAL